MGKLGCLGNSRYYQHRGQRPTVSVVIVSPDTAVRRAKPRVVVSDVGVAVQTSTFGDFK